MFIFELFSYSQKQTKQTLHTKFWIRKVYCGKQKNGRIHILGTASSNSFLIKSHSWKSLISLIFVFSEAERMKLKSVHFWAFFVFSEAGERDFAQWIYWSRNDIPRSRKNGFYHILGTAPRNRISLIRVWNYILGTKNNLKVKKFKKILGNFGNFLKSVQKFLNGN